MQQDATFLTPAGFQALLLRVDEQQGAGDVIPEAVAWYALLWDEDARKTATAEADVAGWCVLAENVKAERDAAQAERARLEARLSTHEITVAALAKAVAENARLRTALWAVVDTHGFLCGCGACRGAEAALDAARRGEGT